MSELIYEERVVGKASARIFDHSGHATTIGRYQIVKTRKDPSRKTGYRTTISYRHQLPAAKRMAENFLAKYEVLPARSSEQETHEEQPAEPENSADKQGDQEKHGVNLEHQAHDRPERQPDIGYNRSVVVDTGRSVSLRVDDAFRFGPPVDRSGVLVSCHVGGGTIDSGVNARRRR